MSAYMHSISILTSWLGKRTGIMACKKTCSNTPNFLFWGNQTNLEYSDKEGRLHKNRVCG